MKRATKSSTDAISKKLNEILLKRVTAFVKKQDGYHKELLKDLEVLYEAYSHEAVDAMIVLIQATLEKSDTASNKGTIPKREYKKRGPKPKAAKKEDKDKKPTLTMAELRPHIEKILDEVKGSTFHGPGVSAALRDQGLNFDPSFVNWSLRSMANSGSTIRVLRKQKLEGRKGQPTNIYLHTDVNEPVEDGADSSTTDSTTSEREPAGVGSGE